MSTLPMDIDPNTGLPTGSTTTPGTAGTASTPTSLAQFIAMLAGGIGNLSTANSTVNNGATAAAMADPWSQFRSQFQTQLASWMQNPSNTAAGAGNASGVANALQMQGNLLSNPQSLTSMPGYQFGLNQALEAVNRGAGASGLANSGNRLTALQDRGNQYAQGWENQIYNQLAQNTASNLGAGQLGLQAQGQGFNQLAGLAGVTAGSPVAAAQAYLQGQQGRTNSIGAGIGGIAGGAAGILTSPAMQAVIRSLTSGSGAAGGGIDLSSISPGDQQIINDILNGGGAGGGIPNIDIGNSFINPGDISDSTSQIIGNILGGGGGLP